MKATTMTMPSRRVACTISLLTSVYLAGCVTNPTRPDSAANSAPTGGVKTAAPACETLPTMSNNQKIAVGAAIGSTLGGILGYQAKGNRSQHAIQGALGGALVGALAGSAFKNEIDVEEQPDGSVRLKIPGSVMFASGQSSLGQNFQSTLSSVTTTVKKYCGVKVRVVGHTDSVGRPTANQLLSERRAQAVVQQMQAQGFDAQRLVAEGQGQTQPVADNGTDAGRQQNRRVEIFVQPPNS